MKGERRTLLGRREGGRKGGREGTYLENVPNGAREEDGASVDQGIKQRQEGREGGRKESRRKPHIKITSTLKMFLIEPVRRMGRQSTKAS